MLSINPATSKRATQQVTNKYCRLFLYDDTCLGRETRTDRKWSMRSDRLIHRPTNAFRAFRCSITGTHCRPLLQACTSSCYFHPVALPLPPFLVTLLEAPFRPWLFLRILSICCFDWSICCLVVSRSRRDIVFVSPTVAGCLAGSYIVGIPYLASTPTHQPVLRGGPHQLQRPVPQQQPCPRSPGQGQQPRPWEARGCRGARSQPPSHCGPSQRRKWPWPCVCRQP